MGAFLEQIMATENLSLELPQAQNALADDVVKIADNFQKLDTAHGTLKTAFLTAQEELKTEITDQTEQFKTAITDQQTQFQAEIDEKTTLFQEKITSEVTRVETAFTEHREAYTQTISDVRAELKSETTALRDSFNEALTAISDQVTGLEKFSELPYILASMNGNQLDVYLEDATNLAAFNKMLATDGMVEEILKTSSYLETICASYSAWSLFKANATAMAGLLNDTTYPNTFTWFINAADFAENAANTTGKTNAFADLDAATRQSIIESTTLLAKVCAAELPITRLASSAEWLYTVAKATTLTEARKNIEIAFNTYKLPPTCYTTLSTNAASASPIFAQTLVKETTTAAGSAAGAGIYVYTGLYCYSYQKGDTTKVATQYIYSYLQAKNIYSWAPGKNALTLNQGGPSRQRYLETTTPQCEGNKENGTTNWETTTPPRWGYVPMTLGGVCSTSNAVVWNFSYYAFTPL